VKLGRDYLVGLAAVLGLGVLVILLAPPDARSGAWVALGTALVVQAPVGWWLVRALGGRRFLPAWIAGMGARIALVALFALVLVPLLGLSLNSTLIPLVAVLLALLLVEVVVVSRGFRQAGPS
jgi:hypothetical protein